VPYRPGAGDRGGIDDRPARRAQHGRPHATSCRGRRCVTADSGTLSKIVRSKEGSDSRGSRRRSVEGVVVTPKRSKTVPEAATNSRSDVDVRRDERHVVPPRISGSAVAFSSWKSTAGDFGAARTRYVHRAAPMPRSRRVWKNRIFFINRDFPVRSIPSSPCDSFGDEA